MKKLIMIGGTMGVGKTTVSQRLKKDLDRSVFLDGDWCWDMHPFVVNEETKEMVMNNITYQLQQFLNCTSIDYILFCWVMHEQAIIDEILSRLNLIDVEVYLISLVCSREALTKRIQRDIDAGLRQKDVLERSLERLEMYESLKTIKIDVSYLEIDDVVKELKSRMNIEG